MQMRRWWMYGIGFARRKRSKIIKTGIPAQLPEGIKSSERFAAKSEGSKNNTILNTASRKTISANRDKIKSSTVSKGEVLRNPGDAEAARPSVIPVDIETAKATVIPGYIETAKATRNSVIPGYIETTKAAGNLEALESIDTSGHMETARIEFAKHMRRYIGETVTVFVRAGGASGRSFTGVLMNVTNEYIRLVSQIGPVPSCGLARVCKVACCRCYYKARAPYTLGRSTPVGILGRAGSIVNIPVKKIVSFIHNPI